MANSVVTVGNGPIKVLALHGWFGCAEGWGPFVDVIDKRKFTYAFMDCRGYGGSMHLQGNYTIAEIASDAIAVADQLQWERFSLLGHSMGGSAIQHVLADAASRVRALVAVTPVPASGVPFDDETWKLFRSAAANPQARRAILDGSTGRRLSGHWLDSMMQRSLERSSQDAFSAYLNSWARTDFSSRIAGAKQPIKVIVGENDPGLTEEVMQQTYMRWYPNAELQVMGNAGHYPMDETPVALATSIEEFLTRTNT